MADRTSHLCSILSSADQAPIKRRSSAGIGRDVPSEWRRRGLVRTHGGGAVNLMVPEPQYSARGAQAEPTTRIVGGCLNVSPALYHQLRVWSNWKSGSDWMMGCPV
ncbi:MAG: hypothetical protein GY762_17985 [Proteobacteria bacterium]|nr:hypothetical protein [Pseudomonadota bacterium]